MRIREICLSNYGHFVNRVLSFGDAPFTLLYGPNESGKSTVLRGIRESLFGFTRHSFATGNEIQTEVLCVTNQGDEVRFTRKRSGKKSTFEGGSIGSMPLDEDGWKGLLGDIDFETYVNLFGFGLTELAAGESLLKGVNLSEALLGGGQAKAVDWKSLRSRLEKEKNELLTQRGRNQRIPTLVKNIRSLQQQSESQAIRPRQLRELRAKMQELTDRSNQLQLERTQWNRELRTAERALEAWPIARRYVEQSRSLHEEHFPAWLTPSWATAWLTNRAALEKVDGEMRAMREDLQSVKTEITDLEEDDSIAEALEAIQRIATQVASQQETQQRILTLESKLQSLQGEEERLLADLAMGEGIHKILEIPIGLASKTRLHEILQPLQESIRDQLALESEREALRQEKGRLIERLDELAADSWLEQRTAAYDEVALKIEAWHRARHQMEELADERSRLDWLRSRWQQLLQDVGGIESLKLPAIEDIEAAQRKMEKWEQEKLDLIRERQQLERTKGEQEQSLRELDESGRLPSRSDLEALRYQRDRLLESWLEVHQRQELPHPLFEGAEPDDSSDEIPMGLAEDRSLSAGPTSKTQAAKGTRKLEKRDTRSRTTQKRLVQVHMELDELVDSMLQNAQRIAKREQANARLQQTERALQLLIVQAKELESERLSQNSMLENLKQTIPIPVDDFAMLKQSVRELELFRELELKIRGTHELFRQRGDEANKSLDAFDQLMAGSHEETPTNPSTAASPFAVKGNPLTDLSLDLRWNRVRQIWADTQKASGEVESIRSSLERMGRRVEENAKKLVALEGTLKLRRADFQSWLTTLGLPDETSPNLAEQLVHAISDLKQIHSEIRRDEQERADHQRRTAEFRSAAEEALLLVGENAAGLDWYRFLQKIDTAKAKAAKKAEQKRERELLLVRSEEKSNAYSALHAQWQALHREQTQFLKASEGMAVELIDQHALRAQAYWEARNHWQGLREQLILFATTGDDLETWVADLVLVDVVQLEEERDRVQLELTRIDEQQQGIARQLGSLEQELRSLQREDPLAEMALKRQDYLAQLEQATERWMVLSVAEKLLEGAMKGFHSHHEKSIAEDTIRIFQRLTEGRYVDVQQDPKDTHRFQVIDREGVAKHPDQLSTGTREQLFLSIRLAHVHHYCQNNEPLPVVMDDCFVNFDDGRLRATLETVREQSGTQQVILLSCHERTRSILQELAPEAKVMSLN